jgi:hypothetical protein
LWFTATESLSICPFHEIGIAYSLAVRPDDTATLIIPTQPVKWAMTRTAPKEVANIIAVFALDA